MPGMAVRVGGCGTVDAVGVPRGALGQGDGHR